ncbi:amidohydrolase family protein [bacterium]|nr:amidohydrolase family protein [bacterium]
MSQPTWDTLITGATVIDGTGDVPTLEDIAIADGKVAARGPRLDQSQAKDVVNAQGKWLMPGLLDIHTHFDLEVELVPGLPEAVRHGTTTVVFGNCSLGLVYGAQRRNGEDPIVDCFARVENIPKSVLGKVADAVDWDDSKAYLDHFDKLALGPNVVPMIPHSMLRAEVMGLKESVSRLPSDAEIKQMENLIEKGMDEGYVGFSTDALPFHYLANDPHRKTKIPSQWGSFGELKTLTNVVRKHDRVWQATPPKDSPPQVARNFMLTSGLLFGKTLKVTAVAAMDLTTNKALSKLALVLSRVLNWGPLKGHFRFQALAAPFRTWWDGPINPLAEEIDELRALNEPDLEERDARQALLNDPDYVERFRAMWNHGKSGFNLANLLRILRRERMAFSRQPSEMTFVTVPGQDWAGESFADVLARLQQWQRSGTGHKSEAEAELFASFPTGSDGVIRDDTDFMLHMLRTFDIDFRWSLVSANKDPKITRELLFNPRVLPGFNDSGAHLTNMAFYDGNLRGLQMAQDEGMDRVAWHVKRLTRDPADFFGINAGRIDVGSQADIILVDPKALASYDSDANTKPVFRDAFGHEQMVNRSDGVVTHTFVAGKLAWAGNDFGPELGKTRMGRVLVHRSKDVAASRPAAAELPQAA